MDYGDIPQKRECIYIIGFRSKSLYQKFEFPRPIQFRTPLSSVINYHDKVEDKYYYTSSCSFYEKLV
ncbi:MAG: hypothetical protein ATN36_07785 [Epulopiscium sp. Nele67-Bin005]|nr:MAG: hypothetical protein ATN36_07785 [Epulopiscium sp. Nele67-Bin005]